MQSIAWQTGTVVLRQAVPLVRLHRASATSLLDHLRTASIAAVRKIDTA
jgi:hypothetical protein